MEASRNWMFWAQAAIYRPSNSILFPVHHYSMVTIAEWRCPVLTPCWSKARECHRPWSELGQTSDDACSTSSHVGKIPISAVPPPLGALQWLSWFFSMFLRGKVGPCSPPNLGLSRSSSIILPSFEKKSSGDEHPTHLCLRCGVVIKSEIAWSLPFQ